MRTHLFVIPFIAFATAQAAPGFKQKVPFQAFTAWAKGAGFKDAKEEGEAYLAYFKAGGETFTVKIEGAGKFEALAPGAKAFAWKGVEAKWQGADPPLIAVKYGEAKATFSVTFSGARLRSQKELEQTLTDLKPELILK